MAPYIEAYAIALDAEAYTIAPDTNAHTSTPNADACTVTLGINAHIGDNECKHNDMSDATYILYIANASCNMHTIETRTTNMLLIKQIEYQIHHQ